MPHYRRTIDVRLIVVIVAIVIGLMVGAGWYVLAEHNRNEPPLPIPTCCHIPAVKTLWP